MFLVTGVLVATLSGCAGPSFSYDTSGAISNSLMEGVRQNEIMAACLLARGYAPQ